MYRKNPQRGFVNSHLVRDFSQMYGFFPHKNGLSVNNNSISEVSKAQGLKNSTQPEIEKDDIWKRRRDEIVRLCIVVWIMATVTIVVVAVPGSPVTGGVLVLALREMMGYYFHR